MIIMNENYDLSVIIITRNEEEMIGRCIESVISAIESAKANGVIDSSEIILSDSASTDRTIDIAKQYSIKIVQLLPNWLLSAAAGLYIGFQHCKGRYIQILGGDHIIDREWFIHGIPIFKQSKQIAAVQGFEAEYLIGNELMDSIKMSVELRDNKPEGETDYAGTAIFKSEILRRIGSYNPYLKGGEDRELSYRILEADYKIMSIPYLSTTHYWAGESGKLDLITHLKSAYKWGLGDGQSAKYHIKNKAILLKYLKHYFNTAAIRIYGFLLLILMMINANILAIYSDSSYLKFATLLIDILLIGLACSFMIIKYKAKKIYESVHFFRAIPDIMVRHTGFVIGFLKMTKDPSTYPTNVKIIKTN